MIWPQDERRESTLKCEMQRRTATRWHNPHLQPFSEVLSFDNSSDSFFASLCHLWKAAASSRASYGSGAICTTASCSPQSGFLSGFTSSFCLSELHFLVFKISWHLILAKPISANALPDNVDLAFPISSLTDLTVTSVVAFSKGLWNFHYFLTLNFYHRAQALSVSSTVTRMRKVKH